MDKNIAAAIYSGLLKFKKYYTLIDATDTYYTASLLDPRVKGDLLLREIDDEEASQAIIQSTRDNIREKYSHHKNTIPSLATESFQISNNNPDPTLHMLQRLSPSVTERLPRSDINEYFDSSRVRVADPTAITKAKWLLQWWNTHREKMPQVAAAARDYLAIPKSEVAVERLFSQAHDLLGIQRFSMNRDTMRTMMLLQGAI